MPNSPSDNTMHILIVMTIAAAIASIAFFISSSYVKDSAERREALEVCFAAGHGSECGRIVCKSFGDSATKCY